MGRTRDRCTRRDAPPPEGWARLAHRLAALDDDVHVLLPSPLQDVDPVVEHLLVAELAVWLVSPDLTEALAHLLGVRMKAAPTLARALARVLERPVLRNRIVVPRMPTLEQLDLLCDIPEPPSRPARLRRAERALCELAHRFVQIKRWLTPGTARSPP